MQVFSRRSAAPERPLEQLGIPRPNGVQSTRTNDPLPALAERREVLEAEAEEVGGQPDEAVITEAITIEGNVRSESALRLEGTVAGDVQGSTVTVSEGGSVLGSIEGEDISIYGRVTGTVRGKRRHAAPQRPRGR